LLSNGTLMTDADVRRDAAKADVVKLSLSAWDQASFERLHRPHPDVQFAACLDAYRVFREGFGGELWIEVFLLAGFNDSDEAVTRIAAAVAGVRPDRIHLHSVARPPAEPWAAPVSEARLRQWTGLFTPAAQTSGTFSATAGRPVGDAREAVLAILRRRPCTVTQLAAALGMDAAEIGQIAGMLVRTGVVVERTRGGEIYCMAAG
jgi:wyosine [tRNA(Phe)-imidazoG37] synthetase (radical SAM superfamily)